MALLSTLRPLPPRLLERLWLLLSGYLPTCIEYSMTFDALNDDCLLLPLDTLSMSQLFQLRGVSRRLCHLIERQSLRKFKTLIFSEEETKRDRKVSGEGTIQVYFATRQDELIERGLFVFYFGRFYITEPNLLLLRLHAWPLSLPLLLPLLSCLDFAYFVADQEQGLTKEHLAVNRLLVPYLNSSWSRTLTTLNLQINLPPKPQPGNDATLGQLNQLTSLRHLHLKFSRLPEPEASFCLPDSMPVFGQLLIFSLSSYRGSNVATLLHQLGPDLSVLVLHQVVCSEDDYVTFLRARPTYRQTLKILAVTFLEAPHGWQFFTLVTQCLTSLEQFSLSSHFMPTRELGSILSDLSKLPNLTFMHRILLSVDTLRVLRLRQYLPGTLPRLTKITTATIDIYNSAENRDTFQMTELFDELLPLLSRVFCRLEKLIIYYLQRPGKRRDEALSEQLSTKVRQLFPALKSLDAVHFVE